MHNCAYSRLNRGTFRRRGYLFPYVMILLHSNLTIKIYVFPGVEMLFTIQNVVRYFEQR